MDQEVQPIEGDESFDPAHRALVRALLNVVRYIPKFQREFEQCRPKLSAAQVARMKPLFQLELKPSFNELAQYAKANGLITIDELQGLSDTALEIENPSEEL